MLKVSHVNDDADTVSEAVLRDGTEIYWLYIENMDATNSIYLSFDGGSAWKEVAAGDTLEISSAAGAIYLDEGLKMKADAADTYFEMLLQQEL